MNNGKEDRNKTYLLTEPARAAILERLNQLQVNHVTHESILRPVIVALLRLPKAPELPKGRGDLEVGSIKRPVFDET